MSSIDIDRPDLADVFRQQELSNPVPATIPQTAQLGLGSAGGGFNQIIMAQHAPVPRNLGRFMNNMNALAQAAGEDYYYSWEVTSKGKAATVEGGSIKLANDLAREYGNCIVDTMVQDNGNEWVFYAKFIDLETGFSMVRPFRQRKSQGSMRTDNDRQLDIVFQIGTSKAIRNVVLNALQSFGERYFRIAQESLVKRIGANLEHYKELTIKGCKQKGYNVKFIESAIGLPVDKWKAPEVAKVIASLKTIADGMATFDDIYPDPDAKEMGAKDLHQKYAKGAKKKEEEKAEEPAKETKPEETPVVAEEEPADKKPEEEGERDPVDPATMPMETTKDVEAKGKELLRRLKDGGEKMELLEAFDWETLAKRLGDAGLGMLKSKISGA